MDRAEAEAAATATAEEAEIQREKFPADTKA
jgi:hypothetical protein